MLKIYNTDVHFLTQYSRIHNIDVKITQTDVHTL
jgi:hypothetical protein